MEYAICSASLFAVGLVIFPASATPQRATPLNIAPIFVALPPLRYDPWMLWSQTRFAIPAEDILCEK